MKAKNIQKDILSALDKCNCKRMIKKVEHVYSEILEYYYNDEEEFAHQLEVDYLRLSGIIEGYRYLGVINYKQVFDLYTDIDRWKELQIYERTRRINNG